MPRESFFSHAGDQRRWFKRNENQLYSRTQQRVTNTSSSTTLISSLRKFKSFFAHPKPIVSQSICLGWWCHLSQVQFSLLGTYQQSKFFTRGQKKGSSWSLEEKKNKQWGQDGANYHLLKLMCLMNMNLVANKHCRV